MLRHAAVTFFIFSFLLVSLAFGGWDKSTTPVTLLLPEEAAVDTSFIGTVTLPAAAVSDTVFSLSASSSAVSIPTTVTVAQGSTQASFVGTAASVTQAVTVTATSSVGTGSTTMAVY